MPIVDYLVFGGSTQRKNARDTISYGKDSKIVTLDEGLAIYTSLSRQLPWNEYYKLLKKLLYKLKMANNKSRSVSARGEPELQKEKIITKALCRVLEGFHFDEIKDVVEVIATQHEEKHNNKLAAGGAKLWQNDFGDLLQSQLNPDAENQEQDAQAEASDEDEEEDDLIEAEDLPDVDMHEDENPNKALTPEQ
jgi:hypothetical protein